MASSDRVYRRRDSNHDREFTGLTEQNDDPSGDYPFIPPSDVIAGELAEILEGMDDQAISQLMALMRSLRREVVE